MGQCMQIIRLEAMDWGEKKGEKWKRLRVISEKEEWRAENIEKIFYHIPEDSVQQSVLVSLL